MTVKDVGDHQLEMAGSTEDIDRMGDSIKSAGWQLAPFKKNPVFLWGHDYSQPPIGRATKVWLDKDSKRLMFNIEFADRDIYPFADTIYKLYKGGFLHATSVGFIPLEWEGKGEDNPLPNRTGNVFTKQELLELSAVPVPANAHALVSAREQGLITVKEYEAISEEADAAPIDTIDKPEETDNYIRIPVAAEEGKHGDCPLKTIDVSKSKGIQAIYCVAHKVITTYLFDKDNDAAWTLASAQEWVDGHAKDAFHGLSQDEELGIEEGIQMAPVDSPKPQPNKISQGQIMDDISYMQAAIESEGLSRQAIPGAWALVSEIISRSMGDDIPIEILQKVGAVLNAKNKQKLGEIQQLAQDVIDSTLTSNEDVRQLRPHEPTDADLTRQRNRDVAEVTHDVIAHLQGKRLY
tara:strand:- start:1569 stop:2789 length:1221 start_codon:yes stop_codon:yes gene_type:complete